MKDLEVIPDGQEECIYLGSNSGSCIGYYPTGTCLFIYDPTSSKWLPTDESDCHEGYICGEGPNFKAGFRGEYARCACVPESGQQEGTKSDQKS